MQGTGRMTFQRYGRSYQLRIDGAADLAHLLHLDESHWMATSAPLEAFTCDTVFLNFVDEDCNGRIRSGEVRNAVEWLLHMLGNRDGLGTENGTLQLDDINVSHDEGRKFRAAAQRVLNNLGKPGASGISLSEVRDTQRILGAGDANGDGIIPPSAAKDAEVTEFVRDILNTIGGETDAGGRQGVTEAILERFLKEAASHIAWCECGEDPTADRRTDLMPLGAQTPVAYGALEAIRRKVDEYFHFCATVSYDPAIAESFRLDLKSSDAGENALERELKVAPIAPVSALNQLNLDGALNPAYKEALQALKQCVLVPLLAKDVSFISEEQWRQACATFKTYADWQAGKPGTKVSSLGINKLKKYLAPRFKQAVHELIETDKAVAAEISAISQVEKLILYQRWLLEFVNNFVSFPRLYDPNVRALFETGTLVMDGRQFTLCVKVKNRAAHARIAQNSRLFILYFEVAQSAAGEKREIAAAVTSGGLGNLYVGKHGIFFDRDNQLWDAQVVQIIENPISIMEALIMPFRRVARLVQSQIERFAGSGQQLLEKEVSQQATTVAATVTTAAETAAQPTPATAAPSGRGAGALLVGGGFAIAALGSSFAFIIKQLSQVNPSTIAAVIGMLVLAVLVPTVINAWVKLRLRDLGTLLEACGWAINGRMRLTRVMQGVFARRPRLPAHSAKERSDQLKKYAGYAANPFIAISGRIVKMGKDAWDAM